MYKDIDYGAPPEPKGFARELTDAEILESDEFRSFIGDLFRDNLEDMHSAIIAHYMYRKDDAGLGRYVREIFTPELKKTLNYIRDKSEMVPVLGADE